MLYLTCVYRIEYWGITDHQAEALCLLTNCCEAARHDSLAAKVLALNALGSHMGAGPNPGSPSSHPAPCLWSRKAVKDDLKPWDPAPTWETQKKLLALGFGSAQLQLL